MSGEAKKKSKTKCLTFLHNYILDNIQVGMYNVYYTGKSLSEALIFAEHGENMLCT